MAKPTLKILRCMRERVKQIAKCEKREKYLSYCTRQRVVNCASQLKIIYLHIGLVSYEL